jgi:hypothetical protein
MHNKIDAHNMHSSWSCALAIQNICASIFWFSCSLITSRLYKMEEDEEQFSTNSDEETHNAEDEPDSSSDTDKIRADLNNRINPYLSTEQWTERHWLRYREETWYHWYNHYWRAMRHIRCGQSRPASCLLDITIRRHQVQGGILEVDVYRVVQSM